MNREQYQALIQAYAAKLRKDDQPATTSRAWQTRAEFLRKRLLEAIGPMPATPGPLMPQVLGEVRRPGFVIERLVLQTRPDVWATCNLYRPDPRPKGGPAVLAVHGHVALGRVDPVVQAYCLGLVKLGFTVLSIDAFGAGERYTFPKPGSYHGALYGTTLWPTGLTLLGCQVYDNRRAVDYLCTLPEVDPNRIGITGHSGGGNQSMYAGALDQRLKAVVPVCSVGTYQAYLQVACCVCEVVPGALTFTEEGDVLGLIAPRSLLVINGAKDTVQFSPIEAAKSLARAQAVYNLNGVGERIKHLTFNVGHGYDTAMREAMYGWMTRQLKGTGTGEPIAEPEFKTEEPNALRCFPDPDQRPKSWLFPPTLALREGRRLLSKSYPAVPDHKEEWESTAIFARSNLEMVLGERVPAPGKPVAKVVDAGLTGHQQFTLDVEAGATLMVTVPNIPVQTAATPNAILLSLDGAEAALAHPLAVALRKANWMIAAPDLRMTGPALGRPGGRLPPDHNPAEHGLWVGRPLLGQWVGDVARLLDWSQLQSATAKRRWVIGLGAAGLVALAAAASDTQRITGLALVGAPTTLLTDTAYGDGIRMGVIAPGLFNAGDVPHLAALVAPRPLCVADGVDPQGARLTLGKLRSAFDFTAGVYKAVKSDKLTIVTEPSWSDLIAKW